MLARAGQSVIFLLPLTTLTGSPITIPITDKDGNLLTIGPDQRLWIDLLYVSYEQGSDGLAIPLTFGSSTGGGTATPIYVGVWSGAA